MSRGCIFSAACNIFYPYYVICCTKHTQRKLQNRVFQENTWACWSFPNHCSSLQLFRSAFPNLVKIKLSNASPKAKQLIFFFSSLSPGGMITAFNWEEVDLTSVAGSEFPKDISETQGCIIKPQIPPPADSAINFSQTLSEQRPP